MQLLDTIVLVASMNARNKYHSAAIRHLNLVSEKVSETFVPLTSFIELDLVMKGRNYTFIQRKNAFDWLSNFVPEEKVLPSSVIALKMATEFEENGMSYFDSLISAIAIEKDATVLTPDEAISRVAKTIW